MSTHPKGKEGWRGRDSSHCAARMRRLRGGVRRQLEPGDPMPHIQGGRHPVAAQPFVGLRCRWTPDGKMIPTDAAIRWADAHRVHACPCYRDCLDDATAAQADGQLGSMTWACDGCPRREACAS